MLLLTDTTIKETSFFCKLQLHAALSKQKCTLEIFLAWHKTFQRLLIKDLRPRNYNCKCHSNWEIRPSVGSIFNGNYCLESPRGRLYYVSASSQGEAYLSVYTPWEIQVCTSYAKSKYRDCISCGSGTIVCKLCLPRARKPPESYARGLQECSISSGQMWTPTMEFTLEIPVEVSFENHFTCDLISKLLNITGHICNTMIR